MTIAHTGHAEIDQQHAILHTMVARLESFCSRTGQGQNVECNGCSLNKQQDCRVELQTLASELGAFLVGHATYEERMMELLPKTPSCQAHVTAHKAAHQGISRHLKSLSAFVASENPLDASVRLWQLLENWLGDHTALFDSRLAKMSRSSNPEINFDSELVSMLDKYVFQNRPTVPVASPRALQELRKEKIETRGRFESLSPAQRSVFWLVVSGNTNPAIAEELGISVNTVKTHRAAVFQKMGVSSVIDLIRTTEKMAPKV